MAARLPQSVATTPRTALTSARPAPTRGHMSRRLSRDIRPSRGLAAAASSAAGPGGGAPPRHRCHERTGRGEGEAQVGEGSRAGTAAMPSGLNPDVQTAAEGNRAQAVRRAVSSTQERASAHGGAQALRMARPHQRHEAVGPGLRGRRLPRCDAPHDAALWCTRRPTPTERPHAACFSAPSALSLLGRVRLSPSDTASRERPRVQPAHR